MDLISNQSNTPINKDGLFRDAPKPAGFWQGYALRKNLA